MSDSTNSYSEMQLKFRLACILAAILSLAACSSSPKKPQTRDALPECGWLPNCVNSQSGRGAQASEPLSASAQQWQQLNAWIAQQQDWEITVNESNFIQAVVKTTTLRFRDDVQLLFLPDEQIIHVRSSSRLGLSDLGTNARRVETLRDQLMQETVQ
jgi:uncharacterized protein (DUF1499 family)